MFKSKPKVQLYKILGLIALSTVLLMGCVGKKDPVALKNFKNLKSSHVSFIEQYTDTAPPSKTWDAAKFESDVHQVDMQFEVAESYESSKKTPDEGRLKAFLLLQKTFNADSNKLREDASIGKYFFSEAFSKHLIASIKYNYDLAIQGENSRDK